MNEASPMNEASDRANRKERDVDETVAPLRDCPSPGLALSLFLSLLETARYF